MAWRPTILPGGYPGSKARLMRWLVDKGLIPDHQRHVVVFGGSGAELFYKPPSPMEFYNDRNSDVFGFFDQLQNNTDALLWQVLSTPYHERTFREAVALLASDEPDPLKRAVAFVVTANMSRIGRCGTSMSAASFGLAIHGHGHPTEWPRKVTVLRAAADRMRTWQIFCRDWSWVINRFDEPDVLFTADPPYRNVRPNYRHSTIDHEALAARLSRVRAKCILFHPRDEVYDAALEGWGRKTLELSTGSKNVRLGGERARHEETIWFNF